MLFILPTYNVTNEIICIELKNLLAVLRDNI
jgi:hypothetical protein